MIACLQELLDYLSEVLSPRQQAEVHALHRQALQWKPVPRLPLVLRSPLPTDAHFRPFPHSEIFDNPEKMLFNELVDGFMTSIAHLDRLDHDLPCTIRANFGTVIMASLFGGRVEQIEENPPWVRPFETIDAFRSILDRDPLDFTQGWCPQVVETYRYFTHVLDELAELKNMIKVVLPDLQGPLDTIDLLRGSTIYTDFYTDPELVQKALDAAATAQIGFAKHLLPFTTDREDGFTCQHATVVPGHLLLRNDSSIMLSPAMYAEQVAPHDERVLRELGGGGEHACGRCEHVIPGFLDLPSIRGLDLGQPELNDVDRIYALASEKNIPIVRLSVTEEEITSGSVMKRFPTGASLVHSAETFEDAQRIMASYRRATE